MKYTDADVYMDSDTLRTKALEFLATYEGTNEFLLSVKSKAPSISVPQIRGVLNVMESERSPYTATADMGGRANEPQPAAIRDGTYTVVFPNTENYVTLKLKTPTEGNLKGKQIASYLNGPDNTRNYQGFAFVNGKDVSVWKRFSSGYNDQQLALVMLVNSDDPAFFGYTYALKSGSCYICGRKLTVPASIYRGMGPICAQGGRDV